MRRPIFWAIVIILLVAVVFFGRTACASPAEFSLQGGAAWVQQGQSPLAYCSGGCLSLVDRDDEWRGGAVVTAGLSLPVVEHVYWVNRAGGFFVDGDHGRGLLSSVIEWRMPIGGGSSEPREGDRSSYRARPPERERGSRYHRAAHRARKTDPCSECRKQRRR